MRGWTATRTFLLLQFLFTTPGLVRERGHHAHRCGVCFTPAQAVVRSTPLPHYLLRLKLTTGTTGYGSLFCNYAGCGPSLHNRYNRLWLLALQLHWLWALTSQPVQSAWGLTARTGGHRGWGVGDGAGASRAGVWTKDTRWVSTTDSASRPSSGVKHQPSPV